MEGMLIEAERAKSRIEELHKNSNLISDKVWLSDTQIKLLKLTIKQETAKTAAYLQVSGLSRKGTYNE